MKKLLLSTIFILIIILSGITVVKGMEIGKLRVLGIKEIREENEQLDITLQDATKLASTDYQKNIKDLNSEVRKLEAEKASYEEMVNISTESEIEAANQIKKYALEMLYTRLGNYAKKEGINNLTMTLTFVNNSSNGQKIYDINFTAIATYVEIEEFITDIEDDSNLGFKIENFKMSPSSQTGSLVQANFTCKNIIITGISENTGNSTNMSTNENTKANISTNSTTQGNTVE